MDPTTAIIVDGKQIFDLLSAWVWPLLRIGAVLMVMPLIGSRVVPRRVRFVFAVGLTIALAPLLPTTTMPEPLSSAWIVAAFSEMVAGIAIGVLLQLAFEVTSVAGELMAQGMGLSFAQMTNPLSGGSGAVMGQLLLVVAGLMFFTNDLHLALIQLLADSFTSLPAGQAPSPAAAAPILFGFLGRVFLVGVQLALPLLVGVLVVNIVFGVLSRTAPALNPIQVGLPATLFVGIALLIVVLPSVAGPFVALVHEALMISAEWVR